MADLHPDIILKKYNDLLKVKPLNLQTKYPYSIMSEEEIVKTMKEIEMTYQNLQGYFTNDKRPKRGGGVTAQITIFTM